LCSVHYCSAAFEHIDSTPAGDAGAYLVTAAVDRLQMLNPMHIDKDIIMQGCVTHCGSSSMEVRIEVAHREPLANWTAAAAAAAATASGAAGAADAAAIGESNAAAAATQSSTKSARDVIVDDDFAYTPLITGYFLFVARHPDTHKAVEVARLAPASQLEFSWLSEATARQAARLIARSESLRLHPPSVDEQKHLHALFELYDSTNGRRRKHAAVPDSSERDAMPMASTAMSTTKIMQPQEKNVHKKIFGGYLMRESVGSASALVTFVCILFLCCSFR
jgi:acyl-coenzyme A thioesterase 9